MKKTVVLFLFLLGLVFIQSNPVALAASPNPPEILGKIKVPNTQWAFEKPRPDDHHEVSFSVTKVGGAVGIRIMARDYPGNPEEYVKMVREILLKNPSYQGAQASEVTPQKIGGQSWATCSIQTRSRLQQELWARKIGSLLVYVIYTAAGGRADTYRSDFMNLIQQISTF